MLVEGVNGPRCGLYKRVEVECTVETGNRAASHICIRHTMLACYRGDVTQVKKERKEKEKNGKEGQA